MKRIFLSLFFALSICTCFIVTASAEEWLWPCASTVVTQNFKTGGAHNGIDIGGQHGTTAIYASKSGTVVASYSGCTCRSDNGSNGVLPGGNACRHGKTMGNYVVINHGNGVYTRYMHMYWEGIPVANTVVKQGDIIGYMGSTGNSTGVHLHFEIRTGGTGVSGGAVLNGTPVNVNKDSINYVYDIKPIEPPSNVSLSADKTLYATDESVNFYYSCEDATSMYLTFYKDDIRRDDLDINVSGTTNFSKIFSETGEYEVYLYAVTPNGDVKSETISFNVLPLPTNVRLSIEKSDYLMNESISFFYTADSAAEMYLTIYKDGIRREDLDVNITNTNHTYVRFTESGQYEAYICAVNQYGQRDSAAVPFDVQNGPGNIKLSTDKLIYGVNEIIKFSYNADNAEEMYLTFYKDGLERTDLDVNISNTDKMELLFNEPGFYEAYICAVNSDGMTNSATSWFTVISDDTFSSIVYNGHTYVLFDIMTKWEDAEKECERLGGHLVTLTSEEEQQEVWQLIAANGIKDAYWLGANNLDNNIWVWNNGETFKYSNWDINEPSNTKLLEHHAGMYRSNGKWNDFVNTGDYACGFICEFDNEYQFVIDYNSNGGFNIPDNQIKIYGTSLYLSDIMPEYYGYIFVGWNTKPDGSGTWFKPGDSYTMNESVTLYAQWEKAIPYSSSAVMQGENDLTVKTNLFYINETCCVIAAGYNDEKLVSLYYSDYVGNEVTSTIECDVDTIRIMVVDSMKNVKPLCKAEVIVSSEW